MKQMVKNWRELETLGDKVIYNKETNTLEIGGNVEIDGNIKDLSKIVDDQGNPRFISGNYSIPADKSDLVSINYAKWSLSGSHLMLVVDGSVAQGEVERDKRTLVLFEIPKWIYDNISKNPLSTGSRIDTNSFAFNDTSYGSFEPVSVSIAKGENNTLTIFLSSGKTFTGTRLFRIVFDFLIDTAE